MAKEESGQLCGREGCGDTLTTEVLISGKGGKAYRIHLCRRHLEELKRE